MAITASSTNVRARQVAGLTAGVAVGGAASAAGGWVISKTISGLLNTSAARTAGAIATRVAPRAVAVIPGIGTGLAIGIGLYSLYQAVKPVVALAQDRRGRDTTNTQPSPIVRPGEVQPRRSAGNSGGSKAELRKRDAEVIPFTPVAPPAPVAATPPAPTTSGSLLRDIVNDAKGMFTHTPDPEFQKRRDALLKTREIIDKQLAKGNTLRPDTLQAQKDNQRALDDLAREERKANPFKQYGEIGIAIGSAFGGLKLGEGMVGKKLAERGAEIGKQVGKLGRKANELLKTSPKGLIAGTPAGDRAKAVVNEAYALGGARAAFPSPGYPGSNQTAQQVFSQTGRATAGDYIPAALNVSIGAAAITRSFYEPDDNFRFTERIVGGFEFGLGVGQIKGLATAQAVRPVAAAAIEGLRNRFAREASTGMPAQVAQVKAGRNLALAKTSAGRDVSVAGINSGRDVTVAGVRADGALRGEKVRAGGRVAVTRHNTDTGVIRAGADAGVAKAEGAGRVARAETRNKLGPEKYKDTWMDTRGRTYHRRDKSVRRAANSNAPAKRKAS